MSLRRKQGKNAWAYLRLDSEKELEDAQGFPFLMSITESGDTPVNETETKMGISIAPGAPTVTYSGSALATVGEDKQMWEKVRDWSLAGEFVNLFIVYIDDVDAEGKNKVRSANGLFSSVEIPEEIGDVEVSFDYTCDGLPETKYDALSEEQKAFFKTVSRESLNIQKGNVGGEA